MRLKARLKSAAAFISEGAILADIGTDHALLPIYLVQSGRVRRAYACDIGRGPLEAATKAVRRAGLERQIELRLGDGLKALRAGEANEVVIAGMGSASITDILSVAPEITRSVKRFVFQPMNDAALLRRWLCANGWKIADEDLAVENGRLYELICAEQGRSMMTEEILFDIGPVLWEKRNRLLDRHIGQMLEKTKRSLASMEASKHAKTLPRYEKACRRKEELEAKLRCL